MQENKSIAVIGGGSWATAIVKMLQHNVQQIHWFVRDEKQIEFIEKFHHNPKYLSSVDLDLSRIGLYNSIDEAIAGAEFVVFAIPAPFLKMSLEPYSLDFNDKFIISAIKGIIPENNITIAEYFNIQHNVSFKSIGIIAGPCHAEEVALERLSYLTIAADDKERGKIFADMLSSHFIRTNVVDDIYGIEYAAVLKNIVAIASGVSHGLGYGDNFQAVLVSNAMREIKRFLDKTYRDKRKIYSSPYLGDLLVTTYSQFSRNRMFGNMIGKGYSVKSAQLEMNMIAEGYYAVSCIKQINSKYQVKMPVMDAVYNILYEKIAPSIEIRLLTEKLK
jgi:glycerol-3-phosphate dehydrogenase (NAD(P)+)